MNWWVYKPIVTVVDVLETGACFDGVCEFVIKNGVISGETAKFINNKHIKTAANSDGTGYGDGYGTGTGYGTGNGTGNGNGYGDGYGDE